MKSAAQAEGRASGWLAPLLGVILLVLALPAQAQGRGDCRALVNGAEMVISADALGNAPRATAGERLLGAPRRGLDRLRGQIPPCDSARLITFLAALEGLPPQDAARYCLAQVSGGDGMLLIPGPRNYRGRCARTVCERVNMTAADAAVAARRLGQVMQGQEIAGVERSRQSSGALLLSGNGALLEPILMGIAEGLGSAIAGNPAVATAAAVTLLAGGGALYLCAN